MAPETLVENQIEDGQRLIDQLVRDGINVRVAFWLKMSEDDLWQLYLASPSFKEGTIGEAYRNVYASLRKIPSSSVLPSDIKLVNGANPIAWAAFELRERRPGNQPIRCDARQLGHLRVDEAYIYPLPGKWFPGFDAIKQNFPTAEVFTFA